MRSKHFSAELLFGLLSHRLAPNAVITWLEFIQWRDWFKELSHSIFFFQRRLHLMFGGQKLIGLIILFIVSIVNKNSTYTDCKWQTFCF